MNGHDFSPDQLHKEGCSYGQLLAKDVAYMREDLQELKAGVAAINGRLADISRSINEYRAYGKVGAWAGRIVAGVVGSITTWWITKG